MIHSAAILLLQRVAAMCQKLKQNNPILKTKVGYIWPDGLIPDGSKKNIADLGREAYQEGLTKYVKWVEE